MYGEKRNALLTLDDIKPYLVNMKMQSNGEIRCSCPFCESQDAHGHHLYIKRTDDDNLVLFCQKCKANGGDLIRRFREMGAKHVVIKGGERMLGEEAIDIFTDGETFNEMASKKLKNAYNHGAGCTYSAAVTAGLANGLSVEAAVCQAKAFVTAALKHSFVLNNFSGATNHTAYKKFGVL